MSPFIPTLTGKEAKQFKDRADISLNKGTIDFSKQVKTAKKILDKAKLL